MARRQKTRKRRHIDRKERRQEQRKVQREIDEAIVGIVKQALEKALQDEVTQLLRRAKGERRDLDDVAEVEACCNRCGTRHRRSLYRAGYYERGLLSLDVW